MNETAMTPADYNRLNKLMQKFSKASNELDRMETQIKAKQLRAADRLLPGFAKLKVALSDVDAEVKELAKKFPVELFPDDKRSHKTPFGSLEWKKSSWLEIEDEEKTVLKITLECQKEAERARKAQDTVRFFREELIRTHEQPNREALERLDDATLKLFGVERMSENNLTVKAFSMKTDKPAKPEQKAAA